MMIVNSYMVMLRWATNQFLIQQSSLLIDIIIIFKNDILRK